MKSVLISIQPKWCEMIANSQKTIEVRKTRPKIKTPFRCYIYCTQNEFLARFASGEFWHAKRNSLIMPNGSAQWSGYVVGEFVCDSIRTGRADTIGQAISHNSPDEACLSAKELLFYATYGKSLYFWHISELKIYDKPKELGEFYSIRKCTSCKDSGYESLACTYDENCLVPTQLTRPPQSWCYVEV